MDFNNTNQETQNHIPPHNGVPNQNDLPPQSNVPQQNGTPLQNQMPHQGSVAPQNYAPQQNGIPPQNQAPYQNGMPSQNQAPYQNGMPPQNQAPYQNGMPSQNQMPYQNNTPNPYYAPAPKAPASGLRTASFILGIAAIVSTVMMTVYFPFIFGGLSIVLALLSKGYEQKMSSQAKTGVICSLIGLVLNCLIVGGSLYTVFSNEEVFEQFDQMYEQIYGESFSDMYEEITGEDFYY